MSVLTEAGCRTRNSSAGTAREGGAASQVPTGSCFQVTSISGFPQVWGFLPKAADVTSQVEVWQFLRTRREVTEAAWL